MKLKIFVTVLIASVIMVILFLSTNRQRTTWVVPLKAMASKLSAHYSSASLPTELTPSYEVAEIIPEDQLPLPIQALSSLSKEATNQLLKKSLQWPVTRELKPRQLQVAILTTWRSGSTFLETVFDAHDGMYTIYEPLLHFGLKTIGEKDKDFKKAEKLVHDLFNCRYVNPEYIAQAHKIDELLSRNSRVWSTCSKNSHGHKNSMCFDTKFLENSCVLFPYTVMKLVRTELTLLVKALSDPDLNLHVVMLVRDPRAVMNSRISSVHWCKESDCSSAKSLCESIDHSLEQFRKLRTRFINQIHFVRYEDICLNPEKEIRKLFKSLGLTYDKGTDDFIKTHTKGGSNKPWSVERDSKKKVMEWTQMLSNKRLLEIQSTCHHVMTYFGYVPVPTSINTTINDVLKDIDTL